MIFRLEWFWRRVGIMGIKDMDPTKPFVLLASNPLDSWLDHLVRRPFHEVEFPEFLDTGVVVIEIESSIKAEPGIENKSSDESPVPVIIFLQVFRQCQISCIEPEGRVVAHSMIEGRCACHDVRVGGSGQWVVSISPCENSGTPGQTVEVGRFNETI